MKNILIDTDILIDFLRGKKKVKEFLLSVAEENTLYCSVITVAEIYAGMCEEEKEQTDDLLGSLNIVEINRAIAEKAGRYRHQIRRQQLELDDCMIAASAFYVKALLVTGNGKHYPMSDIEKTVIPTDRPRYSGEVNG